MIVVILKLFVRICGLCGRKIYDILAEYFSDNKVLKSVFTVALEFELLSVNRIFKLHIDSTPEVKSFIAILLDFYGIDRVSFANSIEYKS